MMTTTMRLNLKRSLGLLFMMLVVTTAWACGSDSTGATSSETCPKDNPECKALANKDDGARAVAKRGCPRCHGDDMSGQTTPLPNIPDTPTGEKVELYPPNLTSDVATGVAPPSEGGRWTDDALATAIRYGVDLFSQKLCPQMQHFSDMSDFEVYSIVYYLRSLPKVNKVVKRSVCPPLKTKEQQ